MRIARIQADALGPLTSVDWSLDRCEVIYDDNQQGKTTLIDLLIHHLFKEGTKKLFEGEDRYAAFPDTTITVERRGETYAFGSQNSNARFSELLGWNMPELHRLLCVRAGEMVIHGGGRKREEMWQLLSGILSGLEGDRVERVKRQIQNQASVTSTFQWSNQGRQRVRDRYLEQLVPQVKQAREAEQIVHQLLTLKQEENDKRSEKDDLNARQQSLQARREGIDVLQRRRTFEQASVLIDDALTLRHRIFEEFGERVTSQFEDGWATLSQELADASDKLGRCSAFVQEIEDLDERIEEQERRRSEWRDWVENVLRPLVQETESRQAALQTARRRALVGVGLAVGGSGLVAAGWLLEQILIWLGIVPGALFLGSGAVLLARLPQSKRRFERGVQQLADTLREQFGESLANSYALVRAREILNTDVGEWSQSAQEEPLTRLEERRNARQEHLTALLPDDVNSQDPSEFWQQRIQELQARERELRSETGCPDLGTFKQKLEERRQLEQKLADLRIRLSQALNWPQEELDLDQAATWVERQLSALEVPTELQDVNDPDAELEDIRNRESQTQRELSQLDQELERIRDERDSVRETFAALGIGLDEPDKLFEARSQWKRELDEAIRDRLAATLACNVLDSVQRDYQTQIKRLLEEGDLNRQYREVMGEDQQVRFNGDTMKFEIEQNGHIIEENGLSSGALTHLYFACRLSILRQLFSDEPGFMILDDPFLTYAPERKQHAIGLLEPFLDDGWQVIAFTVDPATRDGLQDLGGTVRRIQDL